MHPANVFLQSILRGGLTRCPGNVVFLHRPICPKRKGSRRLHSISTPSTREEDDGNRGFYLDVLAANATKRETRAYLSGFDLSKQPERSSRPRFSKGRLNVNLGNLYPAFGAEVPAKQRLPIYVALTVIRDAKSLNPERLRKVASTLSKLSRLGLKTIVILDPATSEEELPLIQTFVESIESSRFQRARIISSIFTSENSSRNGEILVSCSRDHLERALARDVIPIVACRAWNNQNASFRTIPADKAALAIIESFVARADSIAQVVGQLESFVLQRLIILDPHGALPASDNFGQHVFVNLAQEYKELQLSLKSNALLDTTSSDAHLQNLELARCALALLPDSASAIISTPQAAGRTAASPLSPTPFIGVGTRSPRNPLVHNLLTDKPLFSSSLPSRRRLHAEEISADNTNASVIDLSSTLLKRGLPLRIIPDPQESSWTRRQQELTTTTLEDPRIDVNRLIRLIEDSFGRKLAVDDYLKRINPILAGVIIAGDYEGGAILTWEPVPGKPGAHPVPYLDKLAVLRRSQGVGGVADVVFNAMVRTCFPGGLCWRSRAENPVNKWYFERSNGTSKLPKSGQPGQGAREHAQAWTMFWTDQTILPDRWQEYAAVCSSILPTWL